jgi:hypothetical protein
MPTPSIPIVVLATFLLLPLTKAQGQGQGSPATASGTLNLLLTNKNGFVIASDSRMSSDEPFDCGGIVQLYCDNSQKLFRTGPKSAMVIAGFAVGTRNTPLDLTVASVLRKTFGSEGLPGDASDWARSALRQALTGVAALYNPETTSPASLQLVTTFAGFDESGQPFVKRLVFVESWKPSGPLNVKAPEYEVLTVGKIPDEKFLPVAVGINCIAEAILSGYYKTEDPVILRYYQKRREGALDNLPLEEMKSLAQVILRETRNFTGLVGGEDQIGVFPVAGEVEWALPPLATKSELPAHFFLWKGLQCTQGASQCRAVNGGATFVEDFQHPLDEPIAKFFLAGEFKNIPVALDHNYFVNDSFDGVTFKWRGDRFFLQGNHFKDCVLELPESAQLQPSSELTGKCRLVRKSEVSVEPATVGSPISWKSSGCSTKNSDGGVTLTVGGSCGNAASIVGPQIQP